MKNISAHMIASFATIPTDSGDSPGGIFRAAADQQFRVETKTPQISHWTVRTHTREEGSAHGKEAWRICEWIKNGKWELRVGNVE